MPRSSKLTASAAFCGWIRIPPIARSNVGPIVIMAPPSLRHKWPKDWRVFVDACVTQQPGAVNLRADTAESGVQFLKLLDEPPSRRASVIFLTHGALNRTIGDGFAKLAVIKRAFKGRSSLARQRGVFGKWASRILLLEWVERRAPELLGRLLEKPY